ncbi:NADPH-dependent F420 reductase [Adhaeribacter terreus]|uniref:NADPH-dependent F420 reductase n=1 Tax=Adhaeribacter terreus TaxID=529703 RepID=A0ABW0E9V8_9BACT
MKIAVLGTGTVGRTFAERLISLNHEVMIGTRNVADKLASTETDFYGNPPFGEWIKQNEKVKLGTFAEAAAFGEMVLNTTQGAGSINALNLAEAKNLNGKVLMDMANPLDFSKGMPPSLLPELSNTNSLAEEIQKTFPELKVVKALNTMWCGLMVNPNMLAGGDHTAFISGNDAEAKAKVKALMQEFGWKAENILDLGDITTARGTEAMLPVWLRIYGATQNGAFNFKVVS